MLEDKLLKELLGLLITMLRVLRALLNSLWNLSVIYLVILLFNEFPPKTLLAALLRAELTLADGSAAIIGLGSLYLIGTTPVA